MEARILFTYVMMTILSIGLLVSYIFMGTNLGNKDTNNQLNKNLTIIAIVTAICTFIWTVMIYFFFMSRGITDVIPYLLISQGFIMFISLYSLGVSSIQVKSMV